MKTKKSTLPDMAETVGHRYFLGMTLSFHHPSFLLLVHQKTSAQKPHFKDTFVLLSSAATCHICPGKVSLLHNTTKPAKRALSQSCTSNHLHDFVSAPRRHRRRLELNPCRAVWEWQPL